MELKKRSIALLGSTGSIGTQTLDIVRTHPDDFRVAVLTAHRNAALLIEQSIEFLPDLAIIADESLYDQVKRALEPAGIRVAAGADALVDAMREERFDVVVTATVGYSGLAPTLAAIEAGRDIALANKETMVVAGQLVTERLKQSRSRVIPVDSEHSAIYQCLRGETPESVHSLIITASGGPFRTWDRARLSEATVADALRHPKWNMGAKITIDSSTMLNKAFEIIEARWLFDIAPERIQAVVHPQSIVHSMVQFVDGAVKAQLGVPDMHVPIGYALGDNTRISGVSRMLTVNDYTSLTFEQPDTDRFPCLLFAQETLAEGGTAACVVNAANEIAVDAFLHERLRFGDIYTVIRRTLDSLPNIKDPDYEHYVEMNTLARRFSSDIVSSMPRVYSMNDNS